MRKSFGLSGLISGLLLFSGSQAAPRKKQPSSSKSRKATRAGSVKVTPAMLHGKIVFVQGKDLWLMNPDGSARKKFLTNPIDSYATSSDVAISPDLTQIAFTSFPVKDDLYAGNAIYSIGTDGTKRHQLVGVKGTEQLEEPRFSPDGKHLVYSRWTGNHMGGPMTSYADVWIMNVDGSERHSLVGDYSKYNAASYRARWSRDGKRIFYLRVEGGLPESPDEAPNTPEPMSVNMDGTDVRSAKGQESKFLFDNINSMGQKIIVTTNEDPADGGVFIENISGNQRRRLTSNREVEVFDAHFSPNEYQIVFGGRQRKVTNGIITESYGIWKVNIDGSGLQRLLNSGQENTQNIQWLK